jgi:hypothetical protein
LRTAGPWWAIAAAAFIISGIVAAALSRVALPWLRLRALRWLGGAVLVLVLADISHHAGELSQEHIASTLAISLAAVTIAAVMSLCGTYLTARK